MVPISAQMTSRQWLLLGLLSFIWGGSYFFVEVALRDLPPLTLVWCRVTLAAMALGLYLFAKGKPFPRSFTLWSALLLMGVLNNALPFSLIVSGQSYISSGFASIINASTPFFTILVAGVFLADERFSTRKMLGVLVGFSGVAMMMGLDATRGDYPWWAPVLPLLATVCYAFATVFGRRFQTWGVDPSSVAFGQAVMSSLCLLPVAIGVDDALALAMPSTDTILALLGLGVVSTAVAYVMFFKLLATAGATNLVLVTMLVPASAMLLGVSFLGEKLVWSQLAGFAVIGLGLSIIDGRVWGFLPHPKPNPHQHRRQ